MRIETVIVFQTIVACAHAVELPSTDELADKLLDKLVDRIFTSSSGDADLDETTLAKTHPGMATLPGTMAGPVFAKPLISSGSAMHMAPKYPRPQVSANANPTSYMQPTAAASASHVAFDRPQTQGALFPSVQSMEETLKKHGAKSSPWLTFGLSSLAASRGDVKAQATVMSMLKGPDPQFRQVSAAVLTSQRQVAAQAKLKAEELAGVTAPLGFWDPIGFSNGNVIEDGDVYFYRELELKHGRAAMLACLGIILGEAVGPVFGGPPGIPALRLTDNTVYPNPETANAFWGIVAALSFGLETLSFFTTDEKGNFILFTYDKAMPGDYGWDPLGLRPTDATKLKELQNKELNNGRLAMFAAMGILTQEGLTDKPIFQR